MSVRNLRAAIHRFADCRVRHALAPDHERVDTAVALIHAAEQLEAELERVEAALTRSLRIRKPRARRG